MPTENCPTCRAIFLLNFERCGDEIRQVYCPDLWHSPCVHAWWGLWRRTLEALNAD